MNNEYEIVTYRDIQALSAFLVEIRSRTAHAHKEMEIGLVLEGEGDIVHSGSVCHIGKGDMYILNPMELHEAMSEGGMLILAFQVSQRLVNSFFPNHSSTFFDECSIRSNFAGHEHRYEIMVGLLVELAYHYCMKKANFEYKCMSLLNMVLFDLHSYVPKKTYTDSELSELQRERSRMFRITDYIDKNFKRKLLLEEIADQENLSLSYLSHFFKDKIGMTFQDYLNLKRFEYACRLLMNTDKKVLTVCIESGFSDVRYLNALSQKMYNCPANKLRRMNLPDSPDEVFCQMTTQRILGEKESEKVLRDAREECRTRNSSATMWEVFR